MGSIVLLDDLTINKIAAGEVIERPASVVKEMLENSIDAGAKNITIEIKNGGISLIKITDDGLGIAEDDMEIAFERHATSKIRKAEDLELVTTMGFRGEALASIAAVAKVEMISKKEGSDVAHKIVVEGGKVLEFSETARNIGTTITVENLFYNTPVRYKFLKKDYTEAGYIEDAVTRIALVNKNVAIKLISNGKTIIQTNGNGDLKTIIYSIFGKDISSEIIEVNYKYEDISVTGAIGKPIIARGNRANQLFFINGRYIKDKSLSTAADQAYKGMIPVGRYGFIVLNIEMDPKDVDVNVHPAKLEVRFEDDSKVFKAIYHTIKSNLAQDEFGTKEVEKNDEKSQDELSSKVNDILAKYRNQNKNQNTEKNEIKNSEAKNDETKNNETRNDEARNNETRNNDKKNDEIGNSKGNAFKFERNSKIEDIIKNYKNSSNAKFLEEIKKNENIQNKQNANIPTKQSADTSSNMPNNKNADILNNIQNDNLPNDSMQDSLNIKSIDADNLAEIIKENDDGKIEENLEKDVEKTKSSQAKKGGIVGIFKKFIKDPEEKEETDNNYIDEIFKARQGLKDDSEIDSVLSMANNDLDTNLKQNFGSGLNNSNLENVSVIGLNNNLDKSHEINSKNTFDNISKISLNSNLDKSFETDFSNNLNNDFGVNSNNNISSKLDVNLSNNIENLDTNFKNNLNYDSNVNSNNIALKSDSSINSNKFRYKYK